MQSSINEITLGDIPKLPCLLVYESECGKYVVLATNLNSRNPDIFEGTVVYSSHKDLYVGVHLDNFVLSEFEPFKGSVKLEE